MLVDNFEETLWPLFRFKPAFCFQTAIFSELERHNLLNLESPPIIHGNRHSSFYEHFCNIVKEIDSSESTSKIVPLDLLNKFSNDLESDIQFLSRESFHSNHLNLKGKKSDLWCHKNSKVENLAFIDCTDGPVVIDDGAMVSAFSILKGPIYIGKGSKLNKVNISSSRIGKVCNVGGEVADVIMGNYSNKVHEGFLGHSLIGDWVNLGALTTTSDLKNNYGTIRLNYQNIVFSTNTIKFGSIIGDYSKTAIGTMLNTGTVIDVACLLTAGAEHKKYFSPFFWGGLKPTIYNLERFIKDTKTIMARRQQQPSNYLIELITNLHPEE